MITDASANVHVGKDPAWALSRVLIVNDHPFYCDGLASMLARERLARRVDHAASIAQALTRLRASGGYDLILLDLALPGEDGLTLLPKMDRLGLLIPVVVMSSREDEATIRAARAAGAQGFLPKSAGRNMLVRLVGDIEAGEIFFPAAEACGAQQAPLTVNGAAIRLTPRQFDVLQLLARGCPNKRICQQLALTEHTVKTHLKAVFQALDVHNRTECVALARSAGLLDQSDREALQGRSQKGR
jgi:DNA-binding NarL/FixJ family response regulator